MKDNRIVPRFAVYDALRAAAGVTDYRVAKDSGVSQVVISAWRNGRNYPNYVTLRRIAEFFKVSVDDFYPDFSTWGD